jgi:hypothetical protein
LITITPDSAPPITREWEIKNAETYAPYEISNAQQVHSLQGWAWLVCLKGNSGGHPIYFAIFIQNERIVNIRGSVSVDDCPKQLYEPLPLNIWPTRR